jgi:hypothetical protein
MESPGIRPRVQDTTTGRLLVSAEVISDWVLSFRDLQETRKKMTAQESRVGINMDILIFISCENTHAVSPEIAEKQKGGQA